MKRLVATLLLFTSLGVAQAIPVRAPLAPAPPAPPAPARFDIRGTKWFGTDHVENYHITFETDGTVSYGYGTQLNRGGSWTFDGVNLYWEVNGKYREFRGTVVGNVIDGQSWNVKGRRWHTLLNRVK